MRNTIITTDVIVIEKCCTCGIPFGVTETYQARRRDDKQRYYCPSGHGQSYSQSRADRLESELAKERAKSDQLKAESDFHRSSNQRTFESLQTAQRSLVATKGVVTRIKNRLMNGTCPCCNRSFDDLRQHIANKHPNFTFEETTPE